jgi:hypothetical protein
MIAIIYNYYKQKFNLYKNLIYFNLKLNNMLLF